MLVFLIQLQDFGIFAKYFIHFSEYLINHI